MIIYKKILWKNNILIRNFINDNSGASLLELALILPVFLLLLLGAFDFSYMYYVKSVLQGEVYAAARDASLEKNNLSQNALDTLILTRIQQVAPNATMDPPTRTSFRDFSNIDQPEPFSDANQSTKCDNGEVFQDINRNNVWDAATGIDGQGGASDAVVYTVTIKFPLMFNSTGFLGRSNMAETTVRTVVRNQPFDKQQQLEGRCK